jgi:TctA family transporter
MLIQRVGNSATADAASGVAFVTGQSQPQLVLGVATWAAFFAGNVALLGIALLAPRWAAWALTLEPAETFSLMLLVLVGSVVLASGALVKAMCMALLGMLLAQVHFVGGASLPHFSFAGPRSGAGVGFVLIAVGLYGLGLIISNLGQQTVVPEPDSPHLKGLWPTRQDLADAWPAVLRGTALGAMLGVLPGGGAALAWFVARRLEARVNARLADEPEGRVPTRIVVAGQSAHSAGVLSGFLPMLSLGLPVNAVMALMVGAMALKGIQPGPQVMTSTPLLWWGLMAGMGVINLLLLILIPALWAVRARLPRLPYRLWFPAIVAFSALGCYSLNHSAFDLYLVAALAALAYVFHKLGCEPAPLVMGSILGPQLEDSLRRALVLSGGDASVLATRPLSAGLLAASALLVLAVLLPSIKARRLSAFAHHDASRHHT